MKPHRIKFSRHTILRSVILTVITFAALLLPVSAKSLTDYRKNVQTAKSAVDDLIAYIDEPEDESPNQQEISQTVAAIKKSLPAAERIEWNGATVETNYLWLLQSLDDFLKETNIDKRINILTGISERLEAVDLKLKELDNPSAGGHSKDEDKQKLAEILQRAEYQKPEPKKENSENLMQKWYREFTDWLENLFPKTAVKPAEESNFQGFSYVLQILLYVIIAAVIGFLIYKFAPFFLQKYKRREKREKKERVILGERIAADETPENLFGEAEKMAREGNLRGAIRQGYIALLCDLSDRKIIGLAQHKTNRDYLRDVRPRREIFENINNLTNRFERHWYGFQPTAEEDWNNFRREYRETITN